MKNLLMLICFAIPVSNLLSTHAAFALETGHDTASANGEAALFSTSALVTAIDHVDVPARLPGVLAELPLRRGAAIKKGNLLACLDDRRAKMNYEIASRDSEVARQQAENKLPLQLKQTIAKYATKEYEINANLARTSRGAISQLQLQTSKSAMEQASIDAQLALAEQKQLLISLESQLQKERLARYELEQCQIVAPLNGIVSNIHRRPGEWVNAGDSILTMVHMDRLRIETLMHPSEITPQQIVSCRARVKIQLSEDDQYRVPECRIYIAGAEIEPDGRYLIALEIKNDMETDHLNQHSWLVRPGMTAHVDILPPLDPPKPLNRPNISFDIF